MMNHQVYFAFSLVSLLVAGSVSGQIAFFDASIEAGTKIDTFVNTNGHSLGVNWIDYNNDLWPDLFAVNGHGELPHLYRNNGDGTFTKVDELLPKLPNVVMTQSIFADFDNDGDSDIYIVTDNPNWNGMMGQNVPDGPANLLLKNMWVENGGRVVEGQPLFVEVAATALIQNLVVPRPVELSTVSSIGATLPGYRSFTGGWLDYDRDGWVDIYVGNLAPTHNNGNNAANKNFLYRNLGNGTFEDVTMATGLESGDGSTNRPTLAFIAAHMDNDLWPDLYAVNVLYDAPGHFDLFFKNTGLGGFIDFTNQSPGLGETSYAGMGVDVADINLDGNWDIYISDLFSHLPGVGNTLNMGIGDGLFQPNSAMEAGVAASNSWGVNFFDADHDCYEDLFVVEMNNQPGLMYRNNGDGTFQDVSDQAGIVFPTLAARGSAIADYDRDGDLDIAFITTAGIVLYRNDTTNIGNWLQLKLHGTTSNADAIGALVRVWLNDPISGPRTLMRQIKGGSSGHGQDDLVVHFGVGDAKMINRVVIQWPSGKSKIMLAVPVNQLLEITEQ